MTDSTQHFTVVSKTKIELLVLWKDVNIKLFDEYIEVFFFYRNRIFNQYL
jgi:hypothetical protein